jgi:hypothetical protein
MQRLPKIPFKPYIRPEPIQIKGARQMTIGIAAIAERKYIVTASDKAVSVEITSDDCLLKTEPYHLEWSALFSGGDISDVEPVYALAKEFFTGKENTLNNAIHSLSSGFRSRLSKKAEDRVLGRFGITMKDFLEKGLDYFTPEEHAALSQDIRDERLDCCFLSSGFDAQGEPHIFKVSEPGVSEYYDKMGFWAIGSGETAAKTLLLYLNQNRETSLAGTIYNVCSAKFMAEKAIGVGAETLFYVKSSGSDAFVSPFLLLHEIRNAWETEGKPKIPNEIVSRIQQHINDKRLIPIELANRGAELRKLIKASEASPTEP